MKKKIGLSIGFYQRKFGERRALEIAKEIGADAVDFDFCAREDFKNPESVYSKGALAVEKHFTEIGNYARTLGIEISQTHGRILGFRDDKEADDELIENGILDLIATRALGAPVCVMHTTTTIFMGPDAPAEQMHRLNYDMFTRLLPYAKKYGVKIATETFGDATGRGCVDFFGNIDEFEKGFYAVYDAMPECKDYFTVCIDTGHSNKATRYGNPSSADVIRRIGKGRISVLHLNDNDTLTDQHKMPLSGTINWEDVFDALDEVGYDGVYNMELALGFYGEHVCIDTGAFAVKVLRNYLRKRYGANA